MQSRSKVGQLCGDLQKAWLPHTRIHFTGPVQGIIGASHSKMGQLFGTKLPQKTYSWCARIHFTPGSFQTQSRMATCTLSLRLTVLDDHPTLYIIAICMLCDFA